MYIYISYIYILYMFHIDICLYSLFYIVLVYVYTYCIFMYLRLFFPLGGTGRDDIAARLLLHQLHTTAEANHSLRTDSLNLWKSFFWLVKLSDLKMFKMSFVIIFFRFEKLESIQIRSDFCATAAPKSLKHPLAQNQIPLVAMMCHAIELLSFSPTKLPTSMFVVFAGL